MPWEGMTPHISGMLSSSLLLPRSRAGTSLSAQTRYAAGVREILECYFDKKPLRHEYQVVTNGMLCLSSALFIYCFRRFTFLRPLNENFIHSLFIYLFLLLLIVSFSCSCSLLGKLAGVGAHSYSEGNTTGGSTRQ
jgi:hypothetical protein